MRLESQTFKDFVWIIVYDGSDPAFVETIANEAGSKGIEAVVIHNPVPLGMEAASNRGIRNSASEFIVIHDDDDTWEPLFLEKTVGFLRSERGLKYGGVITHSSIIQERIDKDECVILSKAPFNNVQTPAIYLADMALANLFPILSFLYRREYFEKTGGYDETLPVLGDWDFNLKFLLHADIAVIPEILVNYHQRPKNKVKAYDNTVIQGRKMHEEYDAIIRNRMLRGDISSNTIGLGYLVGFGREMQGANLLRTIKTWLKNSRFCGYIGRWIKL